MYLFIKLIMPKSRKLKMPFNLILTLKLPRKTKVKRFYTTKP